MGFGDISWGMVLAGAAATVAFVAIAATPGAGLPFAAQIASLVQANEVATYVGAGVIGGIAGEFVSDLLGRTGSAVGGAVSSIAGR